jgi:hypothetical protein
MRAMRTIQLLYQLQVTESRLAEVERALASLDMASGRKPKSVASSPK